jgi:hypothetical protein
VYLGGELRQGEFSVFFSSEEKKVGMPHCLTFTSQPGLQAKGCARKEEKVLGQPLQQTAGLWCTWEVSYDRARFWIFFPPGDLKCWTTEMLIPLSVLSGSRCTSVRSNRLDEGFPTVARSLRIDELSRGGGGPMLELRQGEFLVFFSSEEKKVGTPIV